MSVGRALSSWERLEIFLAYLFSRLCEAETSAAGDAYGAILAHNTRNDMLKAAARARFRQEKHHLTRALDLLNRVRKLAARRNEIAHGIVLRHQLNKDDEGCYLVPPNYNINKRGDDWGLQGKYRYTSEQIESFAGHFHNIGEEVRHFVTELPASRRSPP